MATNPNLTIGANVNEDEGTVTITANGVELATVVLRYRAGRIEAHTVGIGYKADSKRGRFGRVEFQGSPSFSSEPVIHEVPESVVLNLASLVGLTVTKDDEDFISLR